MGYFWLKEKHTTEQFHFYWKPGYTNLADYFTKHHPPLHHKTVHSMYIVDNFLSRSQPSPSCTASDLQGCIDSSPTTTGIKMSTRSDKCTSNKSRENTTKILLHMYKEALLNNRSGS